MSNTKYTKTTRQVFEYKKQLKTYSKYMKDIKLLSNINYEKRSCTQSNKLLFLTRKINKLKKTIKFI